MPTIRIVLAVFAMLAAAPALAAPVTVTVAVSGSDGRPLAGAVVTLDMPGVAAPRPRGSYAVEQRDIQFQPHVLIVPVGASVGFPNRDKVRHHVYSFSKAKHFDLKLYGREDTRTVTFDQPGPVALGCNIHDTMSGVVFVTATPFAATTDANGRVQLAGVPAARGTLRVWHPSIRAPGNTLSQSVGVPASGLSIAVSAKR